MRADVGFLAIDRIRAEKVSFTRPYHIILTKVEQAMVLPGADNPLITALDDFVARAITDGFVASESGA